MGWLNNDKFDKFMNDFDEFISNFKEKTKEEIISNFVIGDEINEWFYNILNEYFVSKENKEFNELKNKFSKIENFETYLLELQQKIKEEIMKSGEYYKKEISEKGLIKLKELGKPIKEKNKAIRDSLNNLLNKIFEGIVDNEQKEEFINQFKEVIESVDLDKQTKRNLLDWVTNEQLWETWNERYKYQFINRNIHRSLRKLVNYITAGYEPNKILIELDKNNNVICKELEKEGKKENQENIKPILSKKQEQNKEEDKDFDNDLNENDGSYLDGD